MFVHFNQTSLQIYTSTEHFDRRFITQVSFLYMHIVTVSLCDAENALFKKNVFFCCFPDKSSVLFSETTVGIGTSAVGGCVPSSALW